MSTSLVSSVECPLGCGLIKTHPKYIRVGARVLNDHRGTHPNSTKCYWSGRELREVQEVNERRAHVK